jgi:hypothetical protein
MIWIILRTLDLWYKGGEAHQRRLLMSKHSWVTILAVSALVAASTYALAQMSSSGPMGMHGQMPQAGTMEQMHQQMMQGQGAMHGGMRQGGMHNQQTGATSQPTLPGQDAFGAIQEIVHLLDSDPTTDWSKVNIEALRQHLIDMNEVTLHAAAAQHDVDNGIEIAVTGEGRTAEAIKRMVPAHLRELREIGWNAMSEDIPNGVKLTVIASEAQPLTKLKALGFAGIMVQGSHHQPHHLMIAKGQFSH